MQETSDLHVELLARDPTVEATIAIGDRGFLIDSDGERITFGGDAIYADSGGAGAGYDASMIFDISTESQAFPDDSPTVGTAQIGTIEVNMLTPAGEIPKAAKLCPYARLKVDDECAEWIQQGVYFVDERTNTEDDGIKKISLTGYDAMRYAEKPYPDSYIDWPALDVEVVKEIANAIGVQVDQRTFDTMKDGYRIPLPTNYSCRETLGHIAALYVGNFVISSLGKLLLVPLFSYPKETRFLVDRERRSITFGGDRILV